VCRGEEDDDEGETWKERWTDAYPVYLCDGMSMEWCVSIHPYVLLVSWILDFLCAMQCESEVVVSSYLKGL